MKNYNNPLFLLLFLSCSLSSLSSCEQQTSPVSSKEPQLVTSDQNTPKQTALNENDENVILENKSYLFDIKDHSLAELNALLARAEEVSLAKADEFKDLEIVMILHGPDIKWFTQQNAGQNKQLVDLAARLDANNVIDMKVCETSLSFQGVDREDIPAFIESVPYAPKEIKRHLQGGYINL